MQIAGQYSFLTTQYIDLKFKYAVYFDEWKFDDDGKKRSDKWIDNMFLMTKDGQEYYRIKRELKAYEILISTVKTSIIVANNEAKSQY